MPIKIGNLKNSHVLEVAEEQAKLNCDKYEEGEITDESEMETAKPIEQTKNDSSHGNVYEIF